MDHLDNNYAAYYESKEVGYLYPAEFVVRALLGSYSDLPREHKNYSNLRALDLGCGDGRNIPLLTQLGFEVVGLEIDRHIVEKCRQNLNYNNVKAELVVGSNSNTKLPKESFDVVIACHSCYYLSSNDSFHDNLQEIHTILKPRGSFIFSIPTSSSYLLDTADICDDGYAVIRNDPLRIRNGARIKYFSTIHEIHMTLAPLFTDIHIAKCENNWWGINEHCWVVVCLRSI